MQGIRVNCGKVVLACNGTLLVGLVDAGMDDGSGFLQVNDLARKIRLFNVENEF